VSWNTLQDFVNWYKSSGMPFRPPFEDPVYVTDITYSYVLFREGQYQAELYLMKPNTESPPHSHPGVENIIMALGGDTAVTIDGHYYDTSEYCKEPSQLGTSKMFGVCSPILTAGFTHKAHAGKRGSAFISFEKWEEGTKPSSVVTQWEGDLVEGDEHKARMEEKQ